MKKTLNEFTNQYPLSKTLRFELIPQGKTIEHIQTKGLLTQDKDRALKYKQAKKIIDRYHKEFINDALETAKLNDLESFKTLYLKNNRDDKEAKELVKIQANLRKELVKQFSNNSNEDINLRYKNLAKEKLISKDIPVWLEENSETDQDIDIIKEFKRFTTYFTGFNKNRQNIYSSDDHSTAISYRVVNDNLPKFIDNIKAFDRIKSKIKVDEIVDEKLKEKLCGSQPSDFFNLDFYNNCLNQDGITRYNTLLGGISKGENIEKIQGLNELINLKNQQIDSENKKLEDKSKKQPKLPKLKVLFKQILSDHESASFSIDVFKKNNELLEAIESFYKNNLKQVVVDGNVHSIFELIKQLLADFQYYDLNKIFIKNDTALTGISNAIYDDWNVIKSALVEYYDQNLLPIKTTKKAIDEKQKWLKKDHSISLIEEALASSKIENVTQLKIEKPIQSFFISLKQKDESFDLIEQVEDQYLKIEELLNNNYPENKRLQGNKADKEKIKNFLDSIMNLLHFIKVFDTTTDSDKDEVFYSLFTPIYDNLSSIINVYNKVRNYLTQKPYSTEKFKLNFETSSFLSGWSQDYSTKAALIFTNNNRYYMGIVNKKLTNSEITELTSNPNLSPAKRIIYDFQKPDNKNIPRTFIRSKGDKFSPAVERYNLPIENIIDIYDKGKFKTEYRKINPQDYRESLIQIIDYFKLGLTKHESYSHFKFNWKESSKYNDISEFYHDSEVSCYQLLEEHINFDNLLKLVEDGKLYLFQIYNKDFSPHSKGTPNLHTIYWKMIFDQRNLDDVVYKLNGQAEVFYRKRSINDTEMIVHKANQKLSNRTFEQGNKKYKKESLFEYDIVKDKRFTMDKFQFHVPITMNFKASETPNSIFNTRVIRYLKNNPAVNIIGLDRGERHLIYLTICDQQGKLLIQKTLNNVGPAKVDYHAKLDALEKDRDSARKNWDKIENIKEMKSGYLSLVIHEIVELMIEYNAIVVMEDLNFGFKRGRMKVEKQVYQKFEKALIDKLNYLVFKKKEPEELSGALKALQLSAKFESFQKMGKQCGFIFYTSADYTSKIDPTTGFVNLLNPKYTSIDKSKEMWSKFEKIHYNANDDYFEFSLDYNNFGERAKGSRSKWVICSSDDVRFKYNNLTKDTEEIKITSELKNLFANQNIDYENKTDLRLDLANVSESKFHKKLISYLQLLLIMRQSKANTNIDYMISPVKNANEEFYDSRDYENQENAIFPKDADANGAYHIALKGKMILDKINQSKDLDKFGFKEMAIKNQEWFKFAQDLRE